MKRIVLLSVLSLSLFSVACGSDASTCAEATEIVRDECKDHKTYKSTRSLEEDIKQCNESSIKEEQIECSNAGNCDEIFACNIQAALGALTLN